MARVLPRSHYKAGFISTGLKRVAFISWLFLIVSQIKIAYIPYLSV